MAADQTAKIDFLSRPESYPDPTTHVEIRETHMSWVFLADRLAYKLKKPVRYDYLDFSTPALRRHFCEEELRLNARLAPDVYRAVVPLTVTPTGSFQIGGSGTPVDWMVVMRRLPGERMLDSVIRARTLSSEDLSGLEVLLKRFYREAPRIELAPAAYRKTLLDAVENNRTELIRYGTALSKSLIDAVVDAQSDYLARNSPVFDRRVEGKHIVEGHGDLRPEHVFLGPPLQIIDCMEFEPAFRVVDVADDVAFLAMDCDRLGEPRIGEILFQSGREDVAEGAERSLIAFYKSFRACLRARLAIWHLKDNDVVQPAMWHDRAARYLALAEKERAGSF